MFPILLQTLILFIYYSYSMDLVNNVYTQEDVVPADKRKTYPSSQSPAGNSVPVKEPGGGGGPASSVSESEGEAELAAILSITSKIHGHHCGNNDHQPQQYSHMFIRPA